MPDLDPALTRKGLEFFTKLSEKPASTVQIRPIVGTRQPTLTTISVTGSAFTAEHKIDGADEAGDGTVPRLAATPHGMETSDQVIHWTADKHGALQNNRSVLDQLEGALADIDRTRVPARRSLASRSTNSLPAARRFPFTRRCPASARCRSKPACSMSGAALCSLCR